MPTFTRDQQEQMEKAKDFLESSSADLGFMKSLFFGRLRLGPIIPYPVRDPVESARTDELLARLGAFLRLHVDADRIDAQERIGDDVIAGLGELGVMGMTVPTIFGGGGFSHGAYCRVLEQVSRHCGSTAVMMGAHQSIGLKALVLNGTEEQKRRYLPDLAAGRKLAAFCLSEPDVGSDAAAVATTAVLSDDGSHWVLNGQKKFATNAAIAGFMTVMAKTRVGDNGHAREKVTAFIVTPDMPGFIVESQNRAKCGIRGSWQATLRFENMRVPADNVLGQVGKGLKVALGVLDYGRCTLSAGCVGAARKALELCIERARNRRQFGRRIGDFHLIKEKLARMAQTVFAMDAMTTLCAAMVDRHDGDLMLETAACKLFCSEGLWRVADDAVQIWGGEGYMRENGLERMLRDARINRIVEGASEVMTAFISLVGMKAVGESLEGALKCARHPMGNFGRLAHFARDQWDDVVVGPTVDGLAAELENEGRALAGLTRTFARDVLRLLATHRQNILELELLHERVSGSAVELFAMAAVISKLQSMLDHAKDSAGITDERDGPNSPALRRDLVIGKSYCRAAAARIQTNLAGLFSNDDATTLDAADAVLG